MRSTARRRALGWMAAGGVTVAAALAPAAYASPAEVMTAGSAAPGEAADATERTPSALMHTDGMGRPKIVGEACSGPRGVTVVADFRTLRNAAGKKMNLIRIGCAQGDQESGLTALIDAGFDVDPGSAFVCTIDNRPIDPPRCPPPDGYWSYSHGERGGDWEVADSGAGSWDPPRGSLEGWSWTPYDRPGWAVPRVDPTDLFPAGPE